MKRLPILALLVCPLWLIGADAGPDRYDLSVSAGLALPGIIEASFYDDFAPETTAVFTSEVSPLFRLSADYFLLPFLGPCVAAHYCKLLLEEDVDIGYWGGEQHSIPARGLHFVEIEAGIKYRRFFGASFSIEPAVYMGYCHVFSTSPDAENNGFTVTLTTDIQWQLAEFHLLGTAGLMMQAYGGVEDLAYVRSLPVAYFTLGVGL